MLPPEPPVVALAPASANARRTDLVAAPCVRPSCPPSPTMGSREDRPASTRPRSSASTVTGMRATFTISHCAEAASVIHAGTASAAPSALASSVACMTKQISSCTRNRRATRNRSPAQGWKRYRTTTSACKVWWVVCRPFVQMDQTASAHQAFLRQLGERGQDPSLDRRQRLRVSGHHPQAAEPRAVAAFDAANPARPAIRKRAVDSVAYRIHHARWPSRL